MSSDFLRDFFWDMFIADAFIGNGTDTMEIGDFYTMNKMIV